MSEFALQAAVLNLLCSGMIVEGSPREFLTGQTRDRGPYSVEFRVDLDRRRWCFHDACDTTFPIAELTDARVVLISNERPGVAPIGRHIEIRRENGDFIMRHNSPERIELRQGRCQRRPSPGLPERLF